MTGAKRTLPRRSGRTTLLSTVMLAFWRLRQTWGLLFVTCIGIIAAIMLACTVPLYSQVAMTAGLRGIFTASPQNTDIIVRSASSRISSPVIDKVTKELNRELQKNLGPYLSPLQFSIETQLFTILADQSTSKGPPLKNELGLISAEMAQAGSHLQLMQGRLPLTRSNVIEMAITPESADSLHVTVGSVITVTMSFIDANQSETSQNLAIHIVGIFKLTSADDPFWHGDDFSIYKPNDFVTDYKGLVSNETTLSTFSQVGDDAASKGLFFFTSSDVIWYYRFNPAGIAIDDLGKIVNGVNIVKVDNGNNPDLNQSPFIENTVTYQQSASLEEYDNRLSVAQLPVMSLLVLMFGLILFFVSMMVDILVDRQSDAIAILRSRGASHRQIFGALVTQSLALSLIALLAGPFLALSMVRFIAQHSLSLADQEALNLISNNPLQAVLGLSWIAILAVITTLIAMIIAVSQATRRDMLAMRREAARSIRRSLWQQLNLDIVAAIIALTGFGFSVYISNTGVLDAHLRLLLLSPLTLLGSVFLLLAGILLLLRFFPHILRLGTWFTMRSQSAAPMLALAQMARAPRQSVRMTLLLALATAFAIFTLIFTASQSQRILDVAAYQGGADFSGGLPANIFTPSALAQATGAYRKIPGITAVSLGYTTPANAGGTQLAFPVNFSAVDANTFAQAAIWTEQDSTQPLSSLMTELSSRRTSAIAHRVIPAIVDAAGWDTLHLAPGRNFTLNFSTGDYNDLVNFTAIAKVQHIPTAGDSSLPTILVDYQSYVKVYTKNYASSNFIVPLNYAWLRTRDDAASLISVRKALSQGELQLSPLIDRRELIATLYHEPLYLALTGVLILGAITAMFLALVGSLIASWLSARSRLTNFAVMRAIGATSRQVASTLTWEQGIIYTTAIGLGAIFGAIFSALVIPGLVFTSVAPNVGSDQASNAAFYSLQSVPPIQIVIPSSLAIAMGVLVAICLVALAMMVRVVSRPSMSQTLRLNED